MSFVLKIIIGFSIGAILAVIAVAKTIDKNINTLKDGLRVINRFLIARYKALIDLLNILKDHMQNEATEINSLISLLNKYIEKNQTKLDMFQMLKGENTINKALEEIKDKMNNYEGLYENQDITAAISNVQEQENTVGLAIQTYNNLFSQVQSILDNPLTSFIASITNKSNPYKPFIVDNIEEFDDSYVDEDEI